MLLFHSVSEDYIFLEMCPFHLGFQISWHIVLHSNFFWLRYPIFFNLKNVLFGQDGGNIGGSGVHFPSTPGKYLADLRSRANSQQYSSIYEDRRPKIENIERSDGKKSA